MDKYLYFLAIIPVFGMDNANDRIILNLLRTGDVEEVDFEGFSIQKWSDHRFVQDLSRLNPGASHMSEIWPKLLENQNPRRMSSLDWSLYGPILHTLPSDVALSINITDPDILEYFGSLEVLTLRQLATFGERLLVELGLRLLTDEERVTRLGNLLCGFDVVFLEKLPLHTYRTLLKGDVFKTIGSCDSQRLRTLLRIGFKYRMFGQPGTWNCETVSRLGYLVAGLDASQIRKIRDLSVKGISPKVIHAVPVDILENMRHEQLKALEIPSMLAWRRRTRDVTLILSSSSAISATAVLLTPFVI